MSKRTNNPQKRGNYARIVNMLDSLSNDEMFGLHAEVSQRLSVGNHRAGAMVAASNEAAHKQRYADGWQAAMNFVDEYAGPVQRSADELNFITGLICGIPLAGFGELPKAALREASNVLAYFLNDVRLQNDRLNAAAEKLLGRDARLPYKTDHVDELKAAIEAYYTDKDKGGRLAAYLVQMLPIKRLLELRTLHKPGADPEPENLYIDLRISRFIDEGIEAYHDAGLILINELKNRDDRDDLSEVESKALVKLSDYRDRDYGKMGEWLRSRQRNFRARVTSI